MSRWVKPLGFTTLGLLLASVVLVAGATAWEAKLSSDVPAVPHMTSDQWAAAIESGSADTAFSQMGVLFAWQARHAWEFTAITWARGVGALAGALAGLTFVAFVVVALMSIAEQRTTAARATVPTDPAQSQVQTRANANTPAQYRQVIGNIVRVAVLAAGAALAAVVVFVLGREVVVGVSQWLDERDVDVAIQDAQTCRDSGGEWLEGPPPWCKRDVTDQPGWDIGEPRP